MKATEKAMQKAYKILNDIYNNVDNERAFRKNFKTLSDYDLALLLYNDLYRYNSVDTLFYDIALWFKKQGFKVYKVINGYKIINDSYILIHGDDEIYNLKAL